ncbi:MAG: magnesium transporter MgtC [Planctomycetes bacterium SCN 63-9]|nr:MAG: magnesium transporter MgtC [Planctomycetes bacterium SCN 63-9]
MIVSLSWEDVALRLALTVIAGSLIGLDRNEGGHTAGLRTTLLVCLAASVAMIQTNLLLPMTGKTPQSFAVLDLMRLPLGILTGMGFIGGGAILRRGEMVHGVTTAATLWLVTVIGLCLGGGQLGLGMAATAMALVILWALKRLEPWLGQMQTGRLSVVLDAAGPTDDEFRRLLAGSGLKISSWEIIAKRRGGEVRRIITCELKWHGYPEKDRAPAIVEKLTEQPGVQDLRWRV